MRTFRCNLVNAYVYLAYEKKNICFFHILQIEKIIFDNTGVTTDTRNLRDLQMQFKFYYRILLFEM